MEALILSCGTGGGHNAAGAAIAEELKKRGHKVTMTNPYDLKNHLLASAVDKLYINIVQQIPGFFGVIYRAGDLYRRLPFRSPIYFINHNMTGAMTRFLNQHSFDAIVVPHLYAAEILTILKEQGQKLPPVFFLATDYTCIPFTEETDCDYVVTPSADLLEEFARWGIAQEKLYPIGIPVKSAFSDTISRREAKEALGLSAAKRYILVAGGSVGADKIPKIVRLLYRHYKNTNTELIVICGNNAQLYQHLTKAYAGRVHVIGHTDQMALYMRACDIVISKPGGLSSTEAAVSGTALIHITPIPGCETRNMRYFSRRGMCIPVRRIDSELLPACRKLQRREVRKQMRRRQHAGINGSAAADICDLMERAAGVHP